MEKCTYTHLTLWTANNGPSKDAASPRTYKYIILESTQDFADVVKGTETRKPIFSCGLNVITRVLIKGKREPRESIRDGDEVEAEVG